MGVAPERMILEIGDLSHRGEGVGRWQGLVVFVPGAVPGDRVRVTAVEGKKNYLRGRLEEILEASPRRARPRCRFFGRCGGCHLQHLEYPWQLEYKTRLVYNVLRRLGGLPEPPVLPTLGMARPWYYRNKAEFKVGVRGGRLVLGFFAAGTHVVARGHEEPLECHLLDHDLMSLARTCEESLNRHPELHAVREVTLRKAVTGETMVVLEGAGPAGHPAVGRLAEALAERAGVTTVVARHGGKVEVIFGPGYITEHLEDLVFRLSAPSFY
ncbi:MAG: class I SAM-dependent RNA methyltransferase, partial [Firmicutes bacterium]|nr:class I SAM-dependent RNA methyltransferase [Bacillota bacterium]